jgi:phosphoglycolate phosphatase-like HAD superfamily hydrolase
MQAEKVFIDWDGTMTNPWKRYYHVHKNAVKNLNLLFNKQKVDTFLKPLTRSEFKAIKQEGYSSKFIADRVGVPKKYLGLFLEFIIASVNSPELLVHDRVLASSRKALEVFQKRGYEIYIVTLNGTQYVESVISAEKLPISKVYGLPIGASIINAKAQKMMLLRDSIKDQVGMPYLLGQYWMLGDSDIDVWAGKFNGLGTIAVTNGMRSYSYHFRSEIQADYITNDLLAAAKIVMNVKDKIAS